MQAGADECIDMAHHKAEQLKGLLRQSASQGKQLTHAVHLCAPCFVLGLLCRRPMRSAWLPPTRVSLLILGRPLSRPAAG